MLRRVQPNLRNSRKAVQNASSEKKRELISLFFIAESNGSRLKYGVSDMSREDRKANFTRAVEESILDVASKDSSWFARRLSDKIDKNFLKKRLQKNYNGI